MAEVMDQSTMMLVMAVCIIGILLFVIYKMWSNKPGMQVITKNQYERLNADFIASARHNRIPGVKWIGITGDSYHPQVKKFIRYLGDESDARVLNLLVGRGPFHPKRWLIVPWDLVENYGYGKTMFIRCNGIAKLDYFFRPIICKEHILGEKTIAYYDKLINEYISTKLHLQAWQDEAEQIAYETLVSSAHRERPLTDIMQRRSSPKVEEDDIVTDPEV